MGKSGLGREHCRQRARPVPGLWSGNEFVFEEQGRPVCQKVVDC